MTDNTPLPAPNEGQTRPMVERTIGGTTYQVIATFSPKAKETAHEKIRRIILQNCNKIDDNSSK